ncbi:MAG TPA: glycosyltransferase family 2 protein [Acidobacteriota bacterium]|jgi:GT2 family glycosyltransferase
MDVSIIIPTWNGVELLRRFLPSVIEESRCFRENQNGAAEVIVVDDGSTDDTPAYLKSQPVRVVQRASNRGFSAASNSGLQAARFPFVVLLNSDVQVAPGFVAALLEPFSDPQVFAVTARIFEPSTGLLATAGKIGSFRRGFWSVYFNYDVQTRDNASHATDLISAYAVGGFCAFRTEQAKQWGGFDEMFSPFHWEDIDFSYRAWKRGWNIVYQPRAVGWHQASSTIGKTFSASTVEIVAVRNRLLFHWKNIHDRIMLLQHLGMLLLLLCSRWAAGDMTFYQAFWAALKRLPQCRRSRVREKHAARQSDRQIKDLLHQFATRTDIQVFISRQQVEQLHHERLRSPDYTQ